MANKEIILQPSTIETIDLALFDLIKNKFNLHTTTNAGWKQVPVLWISPERSFHVKNKEIRIKKNLSEREELEVTVHELLHAVEWSKDEEWVEQSGVEIAEALWKLGWRRVAD